MSPAVMQLSSQLWWPCVLWQEVCSVDPILVVHVTLNTATLSGCSILSIYIGLAWHFCKPACSSFASLEKYCLMILTCLWLPLQYVVGTFHWAQPAMIYLVPGTLLPFIWMAKQRNEVHMPWLCMLIQVHTEGQMSPEGMCHCATGWIPCLFASVSFHCLFFFKMMCMHTCTDYIF